TAPSSAAIRPRPVTDGNHSGRRSARPHRGRCRMKDISWSARPCGHPGHRHLQHTATEPRQCALLAMVRDGDANDSLRGEPLQALEAEELVAEPQAVAGAKDALTPEPDVGSVRAPLVDELELAVAAGDAGVAARHELVVGEAQVALLAPEDHLGRHE